MSNDRNTIREAVRADAREFMRQAASRVPAPTAAPAATPAPPTAKPAAASMPVLAHRPVGDPRRIAVGGDHGAFALKQALVRYLRDELGLSVDDHGTHSTAAVDYPDIAVSVAKAVADGKAGRGIILDGAGIGSTMAANKVPGARAALCHDLKTVRNSREHNNANILVMGSGVVSRGAARRLVAVWLTTPFAGGRHEKRVAKIDALDRR